MCVCGRWRVSVSGCGVCGLAENFYEADLAIH